VTTQAPKFVAGACGRTCSRSESGSPERHP